MRLDEGIDGLYFVDAEVGVADKKVHDIGALSDKGAVFHSDSVTDLRQFLLSAKFLCGHNLVHHDLKFLFRKDLPQDISVVDTFYLSPLLFPKRPYHKLLKDDKLQVDELNNPVNDCQKARALLYDEIEAFRSLPTALQEIYFSLLHGVEEFEGFFRLIDYKVSTERLLQKIEETFSRHICANKDLSALIEKYPVELAYSLALIGTKDFASLTPPWLLRNYPKIENTIGYLCNTPCSEGCPYCDEKLDIHAGLKSIFGYSEFRKFDGEPMQEMSVQSATNGDSLLTIFPTGGGKSLTFQLPAIMAGRAVHGLTVVISPLQSLMKDQVDNLNERGIYEAVTINGMLDPISRAEAFDRVASGLATMLYISPEMLRSKTIERLLLSRNVVRFVIDEAHCFSAWGQDFRVDYLFIGDFIRHLQEQKGMPQPIPVSCFTATAKQKVISDICDYFKKKLGLNLKLFASSAHRKNLKYSVIYAETDDQKYVHLRGLVSSHNCPAIIYVSRTKKAVDLAKKLNSDGFSALPFHGKMEAADKVYNQNAFIHNEVQIVVATSAFGMGVDKKDVGLVVHYEISDSLENYVQEAGRAGRDPQMDAACFVLYSDNDLDKHFILLNQTKLSIGEIQQVWKSIKSFTKQRKSVSCSALEIAREAGWDDSVSDIEMRVRTSIAALETAGFVARGNNVPHVYATGIMVKNMDEARERITRSALFDEEGRRDAVRIIKSLISKRNVTKGDGDDAESRIDYLADILGMTKESVINAINRMRQDAILADSQDMSVFIDKSDSVGHTKRVFDRFAQLERFLLEAIPSDGLEISYKKLNESALNAKMKSNVKDFRTLLYFLTVKGYVKKRDDVQNGHLEVRFAQSREAIFRKYETRTKICRFLIDSFFRMSEENNRQESQASVPVLFSLTEMLKLYQKQASADLFAPSEKVGMEEMEDALLYLSKIGAMKLDGGFMILYNAMEIRRLADNRSQYRKDNYQMLDEFYKQKIQQVHIVGEYANLMVRDYDAALNYVQDYFQMDFRAFIRKYFKGERCDEIEKNITPAKYKQLFGELSDRQRAIIADKTSKRIVVAAGPGSGKTKVLVHKLASLLLMEDVKHEQLLMLTFSRAAATEFKKRLMVLIGNAAHFVEIKTFHSYCFDLIGKVGNLEDSQDVVRMATEMIERGEVELGRINKSVLVIDEAQDMDESEFALVRALMANNEEMRIVAVGDDDQNIYQFRGADSKYLRSLMEDFGAVKYEMTDNYRSAKPIVELANRLAVNIKERMKRDPIVSRRAVNGRVEICEHLCRNMEAPLLRHIQSTYKGETACVLTRSNDEALRMVCLLNRGGLNARLIQSMDGFRFSDLAEIRYFMKKIEGGSSHSPIISEALWAAAKEMTLAEYSDQETQEMLHLFFANYERINNGRKYRSDLEEFVFESKVEDFVSSQNGLICVSTIHKSKGREFDTVYMLLANEKCESDEDLRNLYVGLTRAKLNLFIHTNTRLFYPHRAVCDAYSIDTQNYEEPEEMMLQLSHKDVVLDYFKDKERKRAILSLRRDDELVFNNNYLLNKEGAGVALLSVKAKAELERVRKSGYEVKSARVRHIVAWRGKEDGETSAVVLVNLYLARPCPEADAAQP